MSIEAARAHFSAAVTSAWNAQYPAIPISYENRKFAQSPQTAWMDFNIVTVDRSRKNVGVTRFVRTEGLVVLEIYVPEDTGSKTLYEMADFIGQAMEEKNYPLGESRNATTMTSKSRHDGMMNGFYRQTVLIPFHFDEAFAS